MNRDRVALVASILLFVGGIGAVAGWFGLDHANSASQLERDSTRLMNSIGIYDLDASTPGVNWFWWVVIGLSALCLLTACVLGVVWFVTGDGVSRAFDFEE